MEFYRTFNARTDSIEKGLPVSIVITIYADCSFVFVIKTLPVAVLLKKAAGIKPGSGRSNKDKVSKISRTQLRRTVQIKVVDMTGTDIEAMTRSIEGTTRSTGLVVKDQEMAEPTKCMRVTCEKVDVTKQYSINEIITLLRELMTAEFVENVDVVINLGIDTHKPDQNVRGTTVLPYGTGRSVRIAVLTQGANAEATKAVGAKLVGMEGLTDQIKRDEMNFDIVAVSPGTMRVVGRPGQVLSLRDLILNPEVGIVTPNVAEAVKNAKAGQVRYCNDKNSIIHTTIGKVNFDTDKLKENPEALLVAPKRAKPTQMKGVYIKKVSISTAMGTGIAVDQADLSASINQRLYMGGSFVYNPTPMCADESQQLKRFVRWSLAYPDLHQRPQEFRKKLNPLRRR